MERFEPGDMESRVLEFWREKDIYRKVKLLRRGGKKFYFSDGPPYATGSIHMGTAQNKILKDAYIRFWRMKGFDVWDQPGYDTHGLPIEYKVENELGFSSKKDIEKYGVGRFVERCRDFATRFIGVMNDQFRNLGVWMDWDKPYLTLDNSYIEGAWHTFRTAHEKGLLYKGKYPVHVCPRCETAVSYNEIEYRKLQDPSVYVKFPLSGKDREYLLVWTTTPWTLPANTAVMANPDFDYSYVRTEYGDTLIMASELVDAVMEKAGIEGYHAVKRVKGKELEGLRYEHPLKELVPCLQNLDAHRVVMEKRHVTLEEGTGLVHTAPGHGSEDYQVGKREKLPMLSPVNPDGTFSKEAGEWLEGRFAKDADSMIIKKLSERNCLLKGGTITHDYPTCWRCSSPLLQISVPQWFFRISGIRKDMLKENRNVNWMPAWAGERFRDWLSNLDDWPVSRQRYWGIPLPIWECACGAVEVIGSYSELRKKARLDREIDFHRPDIDRVTLECPECGSSMRRTPDVLDVWFDSGVSTWASLGYPRRKEPFGKLWPSDFQTEGPDQIRGWWNSQMITGMITFGKPPFTNILFHGFVLDNKGVKMSKSKGNIVSPEEVVERYGRDILRLYLLSSAPWNDFYFNWESVRETYKTLNVLWNSYQFVKTYASEDVRERPGLWKEDRWILSKLNSLIERASLFGEYRMHSALQDIQNFVLNEFSRWYIKIVRDRVSPWYDGKDKKAAQWTLRHVLKEVTKLFAPAIPFMTESIYQDLFRDRISVHAEDWPEPERRRIDRELEEDMESVKEMVEAASRARQEKGIKLKWPVTALYVFPADRKTERAVKSLGSVLRFMANCREVKVLSKPPARGEEFPGGKLSIGDVIEEEMLLRELVRTVQVMRKKESLKVTESVKLFLKSDRETEKLINERKEEIMIGTGSAKIVVGDGFREKGKLEFGGRTVRISFEKIS